MISRALDRRPSLAWAVTVLLALLVNLVVFVVAPWLIQDEPPRSLGSAPVSIAFLPQQPVTPVEEDQPQPPPPPPPPPPAKPRLAEPLNSLTQSLQTPLPNPKPSDAPLAPVPSPSADFALSGPPALSAPPALNGPSALQPLPIKSGMGPGPMLAVRIPPPYPYSARRNDIQGWVKVRILVNAKGTVERVVVLDSEPAGVFEHTVLSTVPRWRFRPGLSSSKAQPVWVVTTIKFELE